MELVIYVMLFKFVLENLWLFGSAWLLITVIRSRGRYGPLKSSLLIALVLVIDFMHLLVRPTVSTDLLLSLSVNALILSLMMVVLVGVVAGGRSSG